MSAKSARRAEKIGYTNVKVLHGGIPAWRAAGFKTMSGGTAQTVIDSSMWQEGVVSVEEFTRLATIADKNTILLDVRSEKELSQGVIPDTVTIPADKIAERISELSSDKQIVVYCKSGIRAQMVYLLLKEKGLDVRYFDKMITIEKDGSFTVEDHTRQKVI